MFYFINLICWPQQSIVLFVCLEYLRQNIQISGRDLRHIVASFFSLTGYSNTVCSTFLLVPLVKGPLVQLTLPGLSLCPLFTGTVTRLMEAETKGGLFLLSCPGLSALLWAQTELRAGDCLKSTGGIWPRQPYRKGLRMKQRGSQKKVRKRGRCIAITRDLLSPLSETAVM